MGIANLVRSSGLILGVFFAVLSAFSSPASAEDVTLVVGESSSLQIFPHLQVKNSPGLKPGSTVLCERIHILGLSRLKHLEKYAHSLKVEVSQNSSIIQRSKVEVCFHRNASREIGMCPQSQWEKVSKAQAMSPFDRKILDIRIVASSSEALELSVEEELLAYRIVFLITGVVLLGLASTLSKSLVFYYSSAMAVGIILVILVVLFQGMKLLPTGRKSSLAMFLYSSVVGLGTFLLRFLPGLLQSLLVEMGISEDMYVPLAIFLGVFLLLAGAWLGFWIVRKLVLTEEGSIDIGTSHFVAWSIRIIAAIMILQSSLDPILAVEALISGIIVSSIFRKIIRLKFLRRLLKKSFKLIKNSWRGIRETDLSPIRESFQGFMHKKQEDTDFLNPRPKNNSPLASLRGSKKLSDFDSFPSSFHQTPERRKISKEEWEKFTRESTKKAVEELAASPDFGRWVAANADRITITPRKGSASASAATQRRRLFLW